jgi:predicted PurR-regulated permease PerM
VAIPPALTFGVQVALGVLAGPIGLAVATPLTAAGVVLMRQLYVEDVLGDRA